MEYNSDLSPKQCWNMLEEQDAILIDVRTKEEWNLVGIPKLKENMKNAIFLEWQQYPSMEIDGQYTKKLSDKINEVGGDENSSLCFLCRSGVRSKSAAGAMTKIGYTQCFNITGGFEGNVNENGQRGTIDGWKFDGLPWTQTKTQTKTQNKLNS